MYVIVTPPTSARGLRKRCLIFATRKFGFIINVVLVTCILVYEINMMLN